MEQAAAQEPVVPRIPPIPEDHFEALLWTLQHIVGLNTAVQRNSVVNNGICDVVDLALVEGNDIIESLPAAASAMARMRLRALAQWSQEQFSLGIDYTVDQFTAEVCREMQIKLTRPKSTSSTSERSTTTKTKLATFTGKREQWIKAKRELTAHLNQVKNINGIPIYYVIRDPEQEEKYRTENGEIGRKIYDAPHFGTIYSTDAFQVLQILREWTSGGSAETYSYTSNDANEVWQLLIAHYEGHDAVNSNIMKARESINTAHWSRNSPNYTFDDYCNRIMKANNELNNYGANVDGVSQVRAFLKGIRADARVNPHLMAVKAIVVNGPTTMDNLKNAIITFKDTMRTIDGSSSGYHETRTIGSMNYNTTGRGVSRNGGRGNNNNNFREGGGRSYGGRGGGRGGYGRGSSNYTSSNNNNKKKHEIYIPPELLNSVAPKFKAMLYKGREVMENENLHQKRNNQQSNIEERNVGSVAQTNTTATDTNTQHENDDNNDTSASGNFGYHGRKKMRQQGAITSGRRQVSKSFTINIPSDYDRRARAEIDTRADTVCAGSSFLLYESTGKVVNVSGFHESMETINDIQVGTCITAIDLENETIIGCFPQSLYFGDTMEHSLIPPAQLWNYGITVDVVPKQYSDGRSLHGIHHPEENLFIPFHMHGCISYFSTRLPRLEERTNCRWVTFTSDAEWDPYSDNFKESERAMINHHRYPDPRHIFHNKNGEELDGRYIKYITTAHNNDINNDAEPEIVYQGFSDWIAEDFGRWFKATSSKEHRSSVPVDVLAKRWGTSVAIATDTINKTTQRGVRQLSGPLTRRFRTRQKQLEHNFLNTKMYTDTFFKDKPSARNNTCFQLFVTSEGFVAGESMRSKADAHEALDNVCRTYGVPKLLVSDNAKEETIGDWSRVLKHYLIQQRVTEPYSGWQNRCEGG
jgi:hypothetical protein